MEHYKREWHRRYGNYIYDNSGKLIVTCHPLNGTVEEVRRAFSNAKLVEAAPKMLTIIAEALRNETLYGSIYVEAKKLVSSLEDK